MRFLKLLIFCCIKDTRIEKERLLYHYVYEKNYKKVLKLLKTGTNPNTTISYNQPIDIAIHNEDMKMIKMLIYYGARLQNDSNLFCNDCRNIFYNLFLIYDCYLKIINNQLDAICKKNNIPSGLDKYLKSFLL